jgi:putative transposase
VPRDHWLTDDEKECIRTFARQHALEGYRRLTFMMLDADAVACSPASVYRVLKNAGLLAGQSPTPTKKGTGFVQPLQPHQHWHVDVSHLNIAGTFYFLCAVLDGCSRFIVHWEIRDKMEEIDVETILQRGRETYPDARPRIISDNGPQFIAKDFKEFIRSAGMTHVKTSPYYPQSNGKIERWYKTLKGDCIRVKVPLSLDDARRIVADYVAHYNNVRLHSAIGYLTPKDKLAGRAQEIFAARDRKLAEARERRKQVRQAEHQRRQCHPIVNHRPAIDFAAVRAALTMTAVLGLLGFRPRSTRGAQQRGPCPLHGSTSGTSRCFSVNLNQHTFHCFKCGRSGNALELRAQATKQTPYDAALDLCQRLHLPRPTLPPAPRNSEEEPVAPTTTTCTMATP